MIIHEYHAAMSNDAAVSAFECWNALIDYGPKIGLKNIALSRYKADGPRFMLMGEVSVRVRGVGMDWLFICIT